MRRTRSNPGRPSSKPSDGITSRRLAALFKDADSVKGYVIFNIRQNRYRLITVIHYAKTTREKRTEGHVYIRSFLTHKEYDNPANWDRRFGTK
jgi:mRNA interferase HigB